MNTNAIARKLINSGIVSTVRSKRIQKDRKRRPVEQRRRNGQKPLDSNSHHNPEPEPHFFPEDKQEDFHLGKELEEIFKKIITFPHKNQRADAKEQGKRIDVVI